MKADWREAGYVAMGGGALAFEPEDLRLIGLIAYARGPVERTSSLFLQTGLPVQHYGGRLRRTRLVVPNH
jgi:hypothetical protein